MHERRPRARFAHQSFFHFWKLDFRVSYLISRSAQTDNADEETHDWRDYETETIAVMSIEDARLHRSAHWSQ
jgi:hypothetical protein